MSTDDDVAGHEPTRPVLNLLGERIRLTELHRRGALRDEEYRRRLAALDRAGPADSRFAAHPSTRAS